MQLIIIKKLPENKNPKNIIKNKINENIKIL